MLPEGDAELLASGQHPAVGRHLLSTDRFLSGLSAVPGKQSVKKEESMRNMLAALLVLAASPAIAQDKEKLSSTDFTVRSILAFKVPDAALQKLLPAGFEVNSPTAGPAKGSNVGIALIDYQMAQDPEGKPLPARPVIAVNMPAKISASGEAVSVVLAGFVAQAAVPGPYFVFGPAKIKVDRRSDTDAEGKSIIDEVWEVNADDGSALQIGLQFTRGALARGKAEAKIHSAAKPEFYRIYRFEQAADLVKSTATGVDRVSKLSFKAAGPKLTSVFDGSEQLISITSIPFYSRSIYVPVM
jgi:hypothetical protein